ncbi:hypothetical protein [Pantoea sp. RHCKP32]|uniref:hypothetical protein n=1 Tax=Pantoea sp. RHCKP32 TaxID=3425182 RepID=UPI003DA10110
MSLLEIAPGTAISTSSGNGVFLPSVLLTSIAFFVVGLHKRTLFAHLLQQNFVPPQYQMMYL